MSNTTTTTTDNVNTDWAFIPLEYFDLRNRYLEGEVSEKVFTTYCALYLGRIMDEIE